MPFGNYTSLGDAAQAFNVVCIREDFVEAIPLPATSIQLHSDINFALKYVGFRRSEFAACENFIYPILREVWKNYLDELMVWSHQPLYFDADLSGTPDYFVARRSP